VGGKEKRGSLGKHEPWGGGKKAKKTGVRRKINGCKELEKVAVSKTSKKSLSDTAGQENGEK